MNWSRGNSDNWTSGDALAVAWLDDSCDKKMYIDVHSWDYTGGGSNGDWSAELNITYLPPWNVAPDEPTLNYPTNNSSNIEIHPSLVYNVSVTDPESDMMTVMWYGNTSEWAYLTLRPEANGSTTNIPSASYDTGDSEHWQTVDEEVQNGATDYVYTSLASSWYNDTYTIQNHTIETAGINSVTVYAYLWKDGTIYTSETPQNQYKMVIKVNDSWAEGTAGSVPGSNSLRSYTFTTNPETNSSFTWTDLDNLQAGIALYGYQFGRYNKVTQLYIIVNYSDPDDHYFIPFQVNSSVASGSNVTAQNANITEAYTDYWWYVVADDGELTTTSEIYKFTTGIGTNYVLTPANGSTNQTSPVPLNVTLTTPSGLGSDIYWYEYHTSSSTSTLLSTKTDCGNGTHTYNWSCEPGLKRWYVYVDTGGFTDTSDVMWFIANNTWSDEFWDKNYASDFNGFGLRFLDDSWVNYTGYYNNTVSAGNSSNTWNYGNAYCDVRTPGPNSVFINSTHGYMFGTTGDHYNPSSLKWWNTTDGGITWTTNNIANSDYCPPAVWYDQWTPGDLGTKIHIAYLDEDYPYLYYRSLDTSTNSLSGATQVTYVGSSIDYYSVSAITKTPGGRIWIAGASSSGWCGYSDDGGSSWTNSEPGLFDNAVDTFQLMPLQNEDVICLYGDGSGTLYSYIYWAVNDTWSSATTITNDITSYTFSGSYYPIDEEVYVSWMNSSVYQSTGAIFFKKFDMNTRTWGSEVTVVSNIYGWDSAIVTSEGNGDIYIFYADSEEDDLSHFDVYSTNSTDGGSMWSTPQEIDNIGDMSIYVYVLGNFLSYEKIWANWYEYSTPDDWWATGVRNYTIGDPWEIVVANLTSVDISVPDGGYWDTFNVTFSDYNDRSNATFSILDASDNSVLISDLDGDNNDIQIAINNTIKIFGEFNGTAYIDSWSVSYKIRPQSKIVNTGSTDIKGYLLIQVQYNDSGTWVVDNDSINETSPRTINIGDQLALDLIFNGSVKTDDLVNGDGTYRVYATFRDESGDVLICDDETVLAAWYEFEVNVNQLSVSNRLKH